MVSDDIYCNFIIMIPDYLWLNYNNDLTSRTKRKKKVMIRKIQPRQFDLCICWFYCTFAMTLSSKNAIFKPFLTAGIIIVVFGVICIWIAEIIGLQEEAEGFRIIGWRFIIGGIVSISLGFIIRHFSFIYKHLLFFWNIYGYKRKRSKYDDLYKP